MQKRVGVEASEASTRRYPDAQVRNRASVPSPHVPHIVVEAENLEEACKKGISGEIGWDTQEMDSDGARKTTLTFIRRFQAG